MDSLDWQLPGQTERWVQAHNNGNGSVRTSTKANKVKEKGRKSGPRNYRPWRFEDSQRSMRSSQ
jgi:hypothetical protein